MFKHAKLTLLPPRLILVLLLIILLNLLLLPFNATTVVAAKNPFKNYLGLGIGNFEGEWIRNSAIPLDYRYQYLAGDVLKENWQSWNQPDGEFALNYMNASQELNSTPVFTYYLMVQSSPGNSQKEDEGVFTNLGNAATMQAYFANFRLLLQKAAAFGQPVIIQVEPDLWAFMQQRNANPDKIKVSVASSGFGDVASGKPDNVAGFAQTLVQLRDKYAPNVTLGYHFSSWGAGTDIGTTTANVNVDTLATSLVNFYKNLNASFDVFFWDMSDRDAGYYAQWDKGVRFWDVNNQKNPNFKKFAALLAKVHSLTAKPNVLWQIPLGNSQQNNTPNHWKDNKVEYLLGNLGAGSASNLKDFVDAGVVALLFGAGAGDQTSYEDDGDVFKNLATAYYANKIPLSNVATVPAAAPTTVVTSAPAVTRPVATVATDNSAIADSLKQLATALISTLLCKSGKITC